MNTAAIERSDAKAETFIVAKCDEGFRVCSPLDPGRQFTVTGIPNDPQCSCPDFTHPERPPEWQCKHILAVLQHAGNAAQQQGNGTPAIAQIPSPGERPARSAKRATNGKNGGEAVMLLKRSVSPDGRIDALSIEFSYPVSSLTTTAIKQYASTILALQGEIAAGFLTANSNGGNGRRELNPNAVPGQLLTVASMNGRFGKRLFLNILVNGEVLKFFGSEKQLAEAAKVVGYSHAADGLSEGTMINLPCRVVTKVNGKYTNIEQVLPAPSGAQSKR